jgi:hypothetical protein
MDQSSEGPGPSVPPRWASARGAAVPDGVSVGATVPDPMAPAPEPEETPADRDLIAHGARSHPPSLRRAGTYLVVAAALLAGVSASRLLPDWEQERWWLVPVVGLPIAAVAGLVALVLAISGAGEARRRAHMSGAPLGVAMAVVATLVLAGVGLRGVDDTDDLDVPAAWDRLRNSSEADGSGDEDAVDVDESADDRGERDEIDDLFGGIVDDAEGLTSGDPELFRTTARIGECRTGDAADIGTSVDCLEPHRLEVTGQVDLFGQVPDDLDAGGRVAAATAACEAEPTIGPPPAGAVTQVVVPDDVEWEELGMRDALCLAVWDTPVEGSQT